MSSLINHLIFSFILTILSCLTRICGQKTITQCVRCTPCGEQQGLERLSMSSIPGKGGDQWSYVQDGIEWTSVLFADNPRKNYIESESSNPNYIYIVELLSSDIGAQPEYYWIDAAQTDICEIAALEHPRRGYHQFTTMIYGQSS